MNELKENQVQTPFVEGSACEMHSVVSILKVRVVALVELMLTQTFCRPVLERFNGCSTTPIEFEKQFVVGGCVVVGATVVGGRVVLVGETVVTGRTVVVVAGRVVVGATVVTGLLVVVGTGVVVLVVDGPPGVEISAEAPLAYTRVANGPAPWQVKRVVAILGVHV